ncbi:MAG: ABC transporter substrate-binding protein [Candidatus Melainabacteria bacterium]|nr:ABC transporter substrate-binding protein [Candidatus Melainabacteria bacterium]
MTMAATVREVTIAHSPDSDDAFMFYGLAKDRLDTRGLTIHQVLKDIQRLNKDAMEGRYEVSAISFAAYPYVSDRYKLMPCGASMGDDYGPILVAREKLSSEDLKKARIAIPGKLTTAYLTLRLYQDGLDVHEEPFDQIIDMVAEGKYDAGLLIHEGQLTYDRLGLKKIVDLGEWWKELTGLPLPLGGNVVRKDLGEEMIHTLTSLLKESIQFSLDNRKDALEYALTFARDMPEELADKFVGMYVNELTVDYGEAGMKAVRKLFAMANEKGIYPDEVVPEFVVLEKATV